MQKKILIFSINFFLINLNKSLNKSLINIIKINITLLNFIKLLLEENIF